MFLVGLTRVRDIEHVRFMPLQSGHSLDHLKRQAPNPRMLAFLAGYDSKGKWQPERTKQVLDELRAAKEAARPNKRQKKTSTSTRNSSPRPETCNDSGTRKQQSSKSASHPETQGLPSHSFSIHGLSGKFKSFVTPTDGSCMFHAFKAFTQCSSSARQLRTELINHIEQLQDPDIRVAHMHQFFTSNIDLVPAQFNTRAFTSHWNLYKERMMSMGEWCGMFEVAQLASMHNKSVVLWQKDSPTTASVIDKSILPHAQVHLSSFHPHPSRNFFLPCLYRTTLCTCSSSLVDTLNPPTSPPTSCQPSLKVCFTTFLLSS